MHVSEKSGIGLYSEFFKEFVLSREAAHLCNNPVFEVNMLEIEPLVR
jgi:hypothetical protein